MDYALLQKPLRSQETKTARAASDYMRRRAVETYRAIRHDP
jgi:hypothetical protein